MTNGKAELPDDHGAAGGVGPAGRGRAKEAAAQGENKKAAAPETDRGAIPFAEVFKGEWAEVCARREKAKLTPCGDKSAPPPDIAGLSLSGGGIRSATFCLGLLQGLKGAGVLKEFDYLSTVSGGGYVGGWWSAWLARSKPPAPDAPERCEPDAAGRPDTWEQDPRQSLDDGDVTFPPREELAPFNGSGERPGGTAPPFDTFRGGKALSPAQRSKQKECDEAKAAHERRKRDVANEKNIGSESYRDRGSAGNDPVHHLRLFGNYLTPRKGALSADTWRAVTVISRNILLTWLVLLPLLVALILAAQLYFLAQAAVHDPNELFYYTGWRPGGNAAVLVPRLWLVVWAALGFGLWLAALICAWMITSGPSGSFRKMLVGYAGVVVVGFIFCVVSQIVLQWSDGPPLSPRPVWPWGWVFWIGSGLALLVYALWVSRGDDDGRSLWRRLLEISQAREVRRNRIVRTHAMVLVALTLTMLALLFAGFGHELVNFLSSDVGVRAWVKKAGGWGAALLAAGGAIYTALKTAPAGGKDSRAARPNLIGRIVITVTPPLVLLVLGVGAAWAINFFFGNFAAKYQADNSPVFAALLNAATCLGVVLTIYFSLSEMKWRGDGARAAADREGPRRHNRWEHLLLAASAVALAVIAILHFWQSVRAFAA
ncbi:MAG: hypothetical protein LC800_20890 [Acidobacteria bacterium]|nr:hypothetical protein [Acidobacteriota bacterium]